MTRVQLTEKELDEFKVGDPFTLTTVLAVLAVAVMTVIVYKLFTSNEGKTVVPGGWTFQWKWAIKT